MSSASKPIHSQPGGGRGKLYAAAGRGGGTYEGTYELPNGKFDRRIFKLPTNARAVKAYTDWCADMDAQVLKAMQDKVRPKAKPAKDEPVKPDTQKRQEADMATTAAGKMPEKIYVVQVVGGVSIAWCESFDKAVAVCDALTLGAKASGFAATYDVVEVKKWSA